MTLAYDKNDVQKCKDTCSRIRGPALPFWGRSLATGSLAVGKLAYGAEVRQLKVQQERAVRITAGACMWGKPGTHRNTGVMYTVLSKGHFCDLSQAMLTTRIMRVAKAFRNSPHLAALFWQIKINTHVGPRTLCRGPVEALLRACARLGIRWLQPFGFEVDGVLHAVRFMNIAAFAHAVRQAGRHMVWKQTRQDAARGEEPGTLHELGLGGGVDRRRTLALYRTAGKDVQGMLRVILCNGVWTNEIRAKTQRNRGIVDPTCPHCGTGEVESLEHVWLRCAAYDRQREEFALETGKTVSEAIFQHALPRCTVRCGIAKKGFPDDFPLVSYQRMLCRIFQARACAR